MSDVSFETGFRPGLGPDREIGFDAELAFLVAMQTIDDHVEKTLGQIRLVLRLRADDPGFSVELRRLRTLQLAMQALLARETASA